MDEVSLDVERGSVVAIMGPSGAEKSGGFGISTPALMAEASKKTGDFGLHELSRGRFGDGCVTVPSKMGLELGDQLLTVRGS